MSAVKDSGLLTQMGEKRERREGGINKKDKREESRKKES